MSILWIDEIIFDEINKNSDSTTGNTTINDKLIHWESCLFFLILNIISLIAGLFVYYFYRYNPKLYSSASKL
jgi:hypothetical protein